MFLEIILDSQLGVHSNVFSQSPETSGRPSKSHLKFYCNHHTPYRLFANKCTELYGVIALASHR